MLGRTNRLVEQVSAAFAAADRLTIIGPCKLKRFGVMVIGTAGSTTAIVMKCDVITQGGTRGDGDGGILTAPSTTQALGSMIYIDVDVDLAIGDAAVLQITTPMGGSGAGVAFADVEDQGFHPSGVTLAKESST